MIARGHIINQGFIDITDAGRENDITLSTSAAVSAALGSARPAGGVYDLLSDINCFIAVASDPSGVTTGSGYPLLAGNVVSVFVPSGYKIGAIAAGAGTLKIHRSK